MGQARLPIERIEYFIQYESFVVLTVVLLLGWFFYKLFLRRITEKRHASLRHRFVRTGSYLAVTGVLALFHWGILQGTWVDYFTVQIANYAGLFSFLIMVTVVIRLAQIYVYLYLFLANMSKGVPRLIANLFTLIFSTFIIGWVAADVFGFNLATVLATSAIFTIVLGLALQDTLGNLFSGVALQIERPFQLGDWVEIHNSDEKWVGQILEITWRATSLIGFSDELIVIPNKTIAQSQLMIFSERSKPARFAQQFRFRFDVDLMKAKSAVLEGVKAVSEILTDPEPRVLMLEVTESFVSMKVFYSVADYGRRYRVGDEVISQVMSAIKRKNLALATNTLTISREEEDLD
ncbi:MAG: mechanosensitive ion channel [Rhizobacter sp.]|nr:mechanosensitive ion channel [Bacteriovorax sp.]